ncbi:sulfotransferase [Desulfosarcina ovata subsp. sediminis]|uniref:Sulfotransferase n=2 Tax=Desulfosarcina ovata TaxID=83564 RepID=A0A5K8A000_9BACT|nr:sulfotransferase [Desulfosarcina ovata subsp. sediminis]
MSESLQSRPFFIIGAQRSGTTLLRLMLNAHSQVAIPEEGGFWKPLLRQFKKAPRKAIAGRELEGYLRYLRDDPQFKLWLMDSTDLFEAIQNDAPLTLTDLMERTYRYYASSNGKMIWGDKSPSFFRMIPTLSTLFPHAFFIHIIRDGRDLFLSWRKMERNKRNVSLVALEWLFKVKKARNDLKRIGQERYMEIRYEDLVSMPDPILKNVCTLVGIEYEPGMLSYWKTSDQFIGAHHSDLIFKPVSTTSVAKWKRGMTQAELDKFEWVAGGLLKDCGYELSGSSQGGIGRIATGISELAYGLPLRGAEVFLTVANQHLSSRYGFQLYSPPVGSEAKGRATRT